MEFVLDIIKIILYITISILGIKMMVMAYRINHKQR